MSRYSIIHSSTITYAYGYDIPLNEFFFQKFDSSIDEDEDDDTVFSISNKFTTKPHPDYPNKTEYSNNEIVKVIQKEMELEELLFDIDHLRNIKNNIPF